MNHATVRMTVFGDTHAEIMERAEAGLTAYLEVDLSELDQIAAYEVQVEEYDDMDAEWSFKATVIARVK
jgi:hypothetical protein